MKTKYIFLFIAALVLLVISIISLTDDILSPYVSFDRAKEKEGQYVQIIGILDITVPVNHEEGYFQFTMKDPDENRMAVTYKGSKPLNFEHADQIVALGRYDGSETIFKADKLLVQCPSKYTKDTNL